MTISALIYSLGSVPMFASRPFLAALLTAILARFGPSLPWIGDHQMVAMLHQAPAWFTSNLALLILGVLAALEFASAKSPEVRQFMDEFDGLLKSAVALLVGMAVLDGDSHKILHSIEQQSIFQLGTLGALASAGLVYGLSIVRKGVVGVIHEMDDQDDVGFQTVLHWLETSWTTIGILLLVLLPIFALIASALIALSLFLLRRRAERLEEQGKVSCAACGARILPHALACFACGVDVAQPRAVGVFGQPRQEPTTDRVEHRVALVARKRCPTCATRLQQRVLRQLCPTCKRVTFAGEPEFQSYLDALSARLPKTLLICFLFGAIPIVGFIPGVVYYRLTLVSGLRGYIPPVRGCLAKWVVRVLNWCMIMLLPFPLIGAVVLPLMCLVNYSVYKRALEGRARVDLQPQAVAAKPA